MTRIKHKYDAWVSNKTKRYMDLIRAGIKVIIISITLLLVALMITIITGISVISIICLTAVVTVSTIILGVGVGIIFVANKFFNKDKGEKGVNSIEI